MARPGETWAAGALIPGTDYRVVRLIGRGGFGEVFEVEHVHLTRRFAVKVLSWAHAGRGDLVERLKREARSLARLHPHPNLVEVTDLRQAADGRAFLVMERLHGRTLAEGLRAGRATPPGAAADVMRQLLSALGAAHRLGLVHRDVKPSNVFVCDDGTVKLLDFGIVKVLTETGGAQTMPGAVVGTPGYMAPEYIEGAAPDARSDVYSAGVVLWEMLAGRSPFARGQSGLDLLARAVVEGVPALEDEGHGALPAGLRAVVRKATARRPDDRYASADEFALGLEAALREGDVPRPARVLKAPAGPPRPAPAATGDAAAPAPAAPRSLPAAPAPAAPRSLPASPAPAAPRSSPAALAPAAPRSSPAAPPSLGAATPRVRYDATTGLAPATPGDDGDEAVDTLRAAFSDEVPGASLVSLFDEPERGDAAPPTRLSEPPSAPSPDRVEYALAYLPTPDPGVRAPRRPRGASRRVVLELPAPGAPPPSAKALVFAPTLPSAAALAPPPSEPGPARAPAPSTAETHVRSLPTPTAVPQALGPAGHAAEPPAGAREAEGGGKAKARRVLRALRASRSGLAALAFGAALGVAWGLARARGGAGARGNTNSDNNEYVLVAPSAAPPPSAGPPAEAPPPAARLAPTPPASGEAPAGELAFAPRASLASATSAASAASAAPTHEAPGPAPEARPEPAPTNAPSPGEVAPPAASAAPSPGPSAALAGAPPASATPPQAVPPASASAPPSSASEAPAQAAPGGRGFAPASSNLSSPEGRPPSKPKADAPAGSAGAPRREGKPNARSRSKGLGPSHDF